MKTKITLLLCLCTIICGYGQDWKETAKKDLTDLRDQFNTKKKAYTTEKDKLVTISTSLSENPQSQYEITVKLKKELDDLYNKRKTYVAYYLSKEVAKDSLNSFFPEEKDYSFQEEPMPVDTFKSKTSYFLFGDGNLIKEEDLIKNDDINKIFTKVIGEKSEANLGKFEIPAVGQLIPVYERENKKKETKTKGNKATEEEKESEEKVREVTFEEVNITLKEGAMEDIRVVLIDKKNNLKYYFENRLAATLLRNTMNGHEYQLDCSFITSLDPTKVLDRQKFTNNCYIILKDVLQYYPNSGNNYVPDDQNLIFPIPGQKKETQDPSTRGVYQLVQNTSLQNTVELRTYTDFLGLFNNSANGVVQVEGKAEFFVNPFRIKATGLFRTFYFFKKIEPYVNFTKIDDVDRGITLSEPNIIGTDTTYTIKNPLQILEKSYLGLGLNLNLFSVKFIKEMPFKFNFYFPLRYNITSLSNDKTDKRNLKMVNYGLGINLEFKKFSNFAFNYSFEYNFFRPINRSETIKNPDTFWVERNEAEVIYYAGESKSQSIFVRFRTFLNAGDDKDSFFQFQFGYRFTIGAGKLKS